MASTPVDVFIVTTHGRQRLVGNKDDSVVELLGRNNVPWSAISIYGIPSNGGPPRLMSCLERRLSDFDDIKELLLYFNRNVNPFLFALNHVKTVESADPGKESTEYFYQNLNNDHSRAEVYLKKLTPEECQRIIGSRVADMIGEHLPPGSKIVVGVSGGGDSNAMLHAFSVLRNQGNDLQVYPVIIKGIPDWDLGVPRARILADRFGLDLTVVDEDEVKALLGIEPGSGSLIERFEQAFKGDDFEFLGTLLIRLALTQKAKQLGTPYIATGINFEDILCESMYRVSSGLKPAPFPVREIGDIKLLFPLWLCPKRIIDGCFPKFSLENYDARYPCLSLGRNLYYSVIYTLQSQYPGYAEQLVRGLSHLSQVDPVTYSYDSQLGFHVERFLPLPLRQKFQRMCGRS